MRRYRIGDRVRWVGDIERVDDRHHEAGTVVGIEYDLPPDGSGRTLDPATASADDPDWQYVGYRVRFDNDEEESYVDGQIEPMGEQSAPMGGVSPEEIAVKVITDLRSESGDADEFDRRVGVEGIAPYGEFYNEVYRLANPEPVTPGADEETLTLRKQRAADLWERVAPHLRIYASRCGEAEYSGWSDAYCGPVRRVRDTQSRPPLAGLDW